MVLRVITAGRKNGTVLRVITTGRNNGTTCDNDRSKKLYYV